MRKLKKCIYGLSDASFKWYTRAKQIVTDSNGVISKIDHSLFICCNTKRKVVGLMAIHVDDFLFSANNDFIESLISIHQGNFVIGKIEAKCLGLNIKHEGNAVTLNQKNYVDNLTKTDIGIDRTKNPTSFLTRFETKVLQSKMCKHLWLCNQTRPNISFQTSNLASNLNRATINELI